MNFYDPYSNQIGGLQAQIANMRSMPHGPTANNEVPWQTQLGNLQNQLATMQNQQGAGSGQSDLYNQLMTPTAMPHVSMPKINAPMPDAMPAISPMPTPTSIGNRFGGAMPNGSAGSAGGFGGGTGNSGGIGTYNSGITAGTLPNSEISAASQRLMQPVSSPFGGALAQQLSDYVGGEQSSANTDLLRNSAAQQAKMNLTRQTAQANSGLNWSDLLARLNESATRTRNAVSQPLIGSVLSQLFA